MEEEDERDKSLVNLCLNLLTSSKEVIETWRRQKRTLEHLPPHLANFIFRRLHHRRFLYPSLLEVFQKCVEEIDLRGDISVDAEWLAYLGGFRNLKSLNLSDCKNLNNHAIWPLSGLDSLKELDLSRCPKITDASIKILLSIQFLEKLSISESGITANGVRQLSYLPNLHLLDLGGLPITDKVLSSLQVLSELEYLDIWGSEVSDTGAYVLEMFPKLSFLNLAWTKVTRLPYLCSITCLNMSNCNVHAIFKGRTDKVTLSKLILHGATIDDPNEVLGNVEASHMSVLDISSSSISCFEYLVNMKQLEHLDLSSSKIRDNSVQYIMQVGETLKYINLSKTIITTQAVSILAEHVPNLETLSLSYTAIDDASLSYIGIITSLKELDLSYTKITGFLSANDRNDKTSSLKELNNLGLLESLNLEETLIGDDAVDPLAFMRLLKSLYLKSHHLTYVALHALSRPLPNLQILGFRSAFLTDRSLSLYLPPLSLRILDLRGCWLLTSREIEQFSLMHPNIEIRYDDGPLELKYADSSSHFSRTLQSKHTGKKLVHAPNFVDERRKYNRNDLLELQLSPASSLTQQVLNMLPTVLRKEIDSSAGALK